MSSRVTTGSFDFDLDYLERHLPWATELLRRDIKLLKTTVRCAKKGRKSCHFYRDDNECEIWGYISFRIEAFVSRIPIHLHSAYLANAFIGTSRDACYSRETSGELRDLDLLRTEINTQRENIKFLWTDIKEGYISLLDNHYPTGDPEFLMYIFDSLLEFIFYYDDDDSFVPLTFLRDFFRILIRSPTMIGVNRIHMTDRLIQVEMVAVKLVRLMCISWFERDSYDEEEHSKITKDLIGAMLIDADPQVRHTCIHVLKASTHIFSPEKKGHIVPSNFIRSLMYKLRDLPTYDTSFVMLFLKFQMQKLHQGLAFLQSLFEEQHNKIDALGDEMKDLILAAVIDAGIVISSLSVNEPKEGLSKETDLALLHLLEVFKLIMAEVEQIYPPTSLAFTFPATNELGSFDFLLENLKELASCEADSIDFLKDQIHIVQEDLVFLRSFLEKILEQRNQNKELQDLWNRVIELGCKAEFVIDSIIVGVKSDCSLIPLTSISEEIKLLKTEVPEIYESVRLDIQAQTVAKSFTHMPSQVTAPKLNEILVGHDEVVKTVIDELTRGSQQLDIVSVVGMAGVGKTTLANKIYNDPSINAHFYIRAWCTVSQVYSEHSLIHQILGDTVSESNEHDLAMKVYQRLKGNRYLIVLDDVWEAEVLNLLQISFPDDKNGSRILLTSRFHDLCSLFKSSNKPHHLRPLSDEECWELLQKKLFRKGDCPPISSVIGKNIAKSCKGLPLTVVVVAGILANIKPDCWEEVANSLSSSTVIATEHCMKTLELSYKHLPDYLKSCLLYFGAFEEDQDISVQRLLRLWISEGFVLKNGAKSLEDVAEEYLMDLIGRSLVILTQHRSRGGAKACRVHDLLHEFCVAKAKEEGFLLILDSNYELISTSYNCHRLCFYTDTLEELEDKTQLYFSHLRCLLLFYRYSHFQLFRSGSSSNLLFIFRMFKLLRVLDIRDFLLDFPREVESLVHLRYLAIRSRLTSLPSGIVNLSKLETFLILKEPLDSVSIALPNTIWNIKKLRHLWCLAGFKFPNDNLESLQIYII